MSKVQCTLCPKECTLAEGGRGNCRVRINLDGKLQTLVYGNPCSMHVDPIEKKPLFHVLPTSGSFSIATAGCNLHCKYCQNWQISQSLPEDLRKYDLPPKDVVASAIKSNCRSIAYTYSDPVIFYEYTLETSKIAHKNNLLNILVTAAYINQEPLIELCKFTDAANVDLKSISDNFYREVCDATLEPVLNAIKTMQKQGVFVELTNLVVPTLNDSSKDIRNLCKWIKKDLGPDVPIHFSRFWPTHKLKNLPPTPVETLTNAWEIAKQEGINFPYVGNVPGHKGNNTYCPNDNKLLIQRKGYRILENHIVNGKCEFCDYPIPGIWT